MRRLRLSPARYVWLCRLALVGLIGIVFTGGAVRLTGSGLGCTDWPTCEHDRLVAPLQFHPMVEFVNRVFTGGVSVLVIAAVLGALARRPRRRDLVVLALGLVAGVIGQILLGAALVLADLDPRFTIGHFLLSAALVANAVVLLHRAGRLDLDLDVDVDLDLDRPAGPENGARARGPDDVPRAVRRSTALLVVLAGGVLATGTLVTGSGPHGGDDRAARLAFDVSSVARVHSAVVWAFIATLVLTSLLVARSEGSGPRLTALRRLLLLAVLQGGLGYAQYFAGVPPLLVAFHLLGATLVWAGAVEAGLLVAERRSGPLPVEHDVTADVTGDGMDDVTGGAALGERPTSPAWGVTTGLRPPSAGEVPDTLAGGSSAASPVPAPHGEAVGVEVD